MLLEDSKKRRKRWEGEVFVDRFTSQVMTLIHQSIPIQVKNIIKDKMGRYLIIQGSLLVESLILMNVYALNLDEPTFSLTYFFTPLSLSGKYLKGRDFNCTFDPRSIAERNRKE